MKTLSLIIIVIVFIITCAIIVASKTKLRVIKDKIKQLQSELNGITDNYSHKMAMTDKANLYARKNELIFAIKKLKELL